MSSVPLPRIQHDADGQVSVPDFMELMRSFNEVTTQLERTHDALRAEVASLKLDLEEANERLRRSRSLAALGEMAAGIAHEIRNPLGSMALNVGLLREDLAEQPDSLLLCEKISKAVGGLDAIVGDVLSFARDTSIVPVECDAGRIIEATLASNLALIEEIGIRIDQRITLPGLVYVDEGSVVQALTNVVRNACEALVGSGTEHPCIAIEVERVNMRCSSDGTRSMFDRFTISDNGPGIPADLRDRVFNPFFTTRETGTGLGLAIVHRIVDAHGGTLAIQDGNPGTQVQIGFPTCQKQAEQDGAGVSLTRAVRDRIENHDQTRRSK